MSIGEASCYDVIPHGSKNSSSCCRRLRYKAKKVIFHYHFSCFHKNITSIKGITHGGSISITKESYHYALSCEMAQVTRAFYDNCVFSLRPFDGNMLYTDIDLEKHSHLSTTYILD